MNTLYYKGIKITYEPAFAAFDFQVAGHSFSTAQFSAVFAIINEYLEVT